MKRKTETKIKAPVQSAKDALISMLQGTESYLRREALAADEVVRKLTAKMTSAANAMHELEWLESKAETIAMSFLAERVLALASMEKNPMLLEDALAYVVNEEREKLICNRYRGSSTSAYSNAAEAARRTAGSYFIQRFSGRAEELKEARATAAAEAQ